MRAKRPPAHRPLPDREPTPLLGEVVAGRQAGLAGSNDDDAVFIHLLLSFPDGRSGERRARLITIAAYVEHHRGRRELVDAPRGDGGGARNRALVRVDQSLADALDGSSASSRLRFDGARVVYDARVDGRQRGNRPRLRIRDRRVPSARLTVRITGSVSWVTATVSRRRMTLRVAA